MYFSRFLNRVRPTRQARLITNYPTLRDTKPDGKPIVVEGAAAKSAEQSLKYATTNVGHELTALTDWDKKVLVLTRTYKRINDIPEKIAIAEMDRARNNFRRRLGIFFGISTLIGFYFTVQSGKSRSGEGDILFNRNLVTHGKRDAE